MRHLAWACPALESSRRQWRLDDRSLDHFLRSGGPLEADGEHALRSRCLVKDPRSDYPLPLAARLVRTAGPRAGEPLEGVVFLDGSAFLVQDRVLARAGWAACATDNAGAEISSIFGTVPWPWPQESGAGELLVAAEALAHALPPIHLYSDSQLLLDGWEAGEDWRMNWNRPYREIWKLFWSRAHDVGYEFIRISKVKGHASMNDVYSGAIADWQRRGNRCADARAKEGANVILLRQPCPRPHP